MAAWPGSLPEIEINASETRQPGFIRFGPETGPSKQRKRFTKVVRFISGTILIDSTQRATFDTFYDTTINGGADEFDFTDPADGGTVSVRFTSPPEFNYLVGGASGVGLTRVSIALEVV